MAQRRINHYFTWLSEMAKIFLESAALINTSTTHTRPGECNKVKSALYSLSQKAAFQRRNIRSRLYSDFITPIERGDILSTADSLCIAAEQLYAAYSDICLFGITKMRPEIIELAKLLYNISSQICSLFAIFYDYKNHRNLLPYIDEIIRMSKESQAIIYSACESLSVVSNPLEVVVWLRIYDKFSDSFSACRIIAEGIDLVMLKNT